MGRHLLVIICGILVGMGIGYMVKFSLPNIQKASIISPLARHVFHVSQKQVIGFLPYWLLDTAQPDYSRDITTLTYFGLAIQHDGTIMKLSNPQELQPGWNGLASGKAGAFLENAKKQKITLSLLLDTGDIATIDTLLSDPIPHARNLTQDVKPILQNYGFSDLNLDIEYTKEASATARLHFTEFVREVKKNIGPHMTLTVEVSPIDVIKKQLIDVSAVGKIADAIVIMAYDYHSPDSYVTGPVAPLSGAGTVSEYDVATAVAHGLQQVSPEKMILGIPLYGYEWETIGSTPRSAVIPDTGVLASNHRAEQLLTSCASCSAAFDPAAQESMILYKDQGSGTYHQLFYPDQHAIESKIAFADEASLGGVALWALGYEGEHILTPLESYIK